MSNSQEQAEVAVAKPERRGIPAKMIPLIVVGVILLGAFAAMSRPSFGTRIAKDKSVKVIVGDATGGKEIQFPISLQEGSDPLHEVDHVIEPLKGLDGVASATLDWSSGFTLTIAYDPNAITSDELSGAMARGGYVSESPKQ